MAINPHFPNAGNTPSIGGMDVSVSTSVPRTTGKTDGSTDEKPDDAKNPSDGSLAESSVDEQLVQRTKLQIRALVKEIAELSKSDCSIEDFFKGFLTRTVSALASVGGAIWIRTSPDSPLQLSYQINLKKTGLADDQAAQKQHGMLLTELLEAGEPTLVGPHSGTDQQSETGIQGSANAGNPTDFMLIVGTLNIDQQTTGLVEIFQRPGAGPATQRGYLRFLTQMCEIASDFLRTQQLRNFHEQQQVWQQLEQFIRRVHCGLDREQVVYSIANEGRRFLECDRVSVATLRGNRAAIRAVSGLDSIERRAEQVKKLAALTTHVIRSREPLWYSGDDEDLPPQIERRLHDYVDHSHCRLLGILPLFAVENEADDDATMDRGKRQSRPQLLGAVILEQLSDANLTDTLQNRALMVAEHGQMAMSNVAEHHSIFLMPLWKTIGKTTSWFQGTNLIKTAAIMAVLAATIAFLSLFPYPFALGAKGQLIPGKQHEVFAPVDGVLAEILVSDNADSLVQHGQVLARMTNSDLMLEIENLDGELQRVKKSIIAIQRARTEQMSNYDQIMLDGEYEEAVETARSLEEKLKIKLAEAELLNVTSPADGQVINWQIRQNLLRRPVNRGQKLMTVIDPNTVWQIELELPERRVSHLLNALKESGESLEVTFALASYPGEEFVGRLLSIDQQLNVYSEEGNSVLVRVEFENGQIPRDLLRNGTRVNAQIQCGQRSVGYVVFQDLIETVQSTFIFWF